MVRGHGRLWKKGAMRDIVFRLLSSIYLTSSSVSVLQIHVFANNKNMFILNPLLSIIFRVVTTGLALLSVASLRVTLLRVA